MTFNKSISAYLPIDCKALPVPLACQLRLSHCGVRAHQGKMSGFTPRFGDALPIRRCSGRRKLKALAELPFSLVGATSSISFTARQSGRGLSVHRLTETSARKPSEMEHGRRRKL